MTAELEPYVPGPHADLLDPSTDSWVASVADVVKLAGYICGTEFVPNGFRGSAPATAAAILYGREIGVAPMTALQTLHVIHGRVGMAAELMRASVLAAGHEIEFTETTTNVCRVRGRRRGSQTWTEVAWSMGDARQAGLNGDGWRKYPRAMLVARASAELCRLVFPDVTHGLAAVEEIDAGPADDTTPQTPPRLVSRRGRRGTANPAGPVPGPDAAPPPPGDEPPTVAPPETPPPAVDDLDASAPSTPPAGAPPTQPPPPPLPGEGWDPNEVASTVDEPDAREAAQLRGDGPATQPQIRHVMALLRRLSVGSERDDRIRITQALVQRRVESFQQVTMSEMSKVITALLLATESADPGEYLRWLVDEGHVMLADREAQTELAEEQESLGEE